MVGFSLCISMYLLFFLFLTRKLNFNRADTECPLKASRCSSELQLVLQTIAVFDRSIAIINLKLEWTSGGGLLALLAVCV